MAKEINIHVKTPGAQQSKQEIDGVAQSAEKLGQTTEQAGTKTSRASSWIMDGLKSLIGPLGFAAIATTLASASLKVAKFFDELKTRCDEAVRNVQSIRQAYTDLFEAMDAFDEKSRQKVTSETTALLKETAVSKEIGLPVINAYTRQFRELVKSGQLAEEQYQQGLRETLGYAERHGGAATAELVTLMRGWGIAISEQQGIFRRQIAAGAAASGLTDAELIEALGRSVPTAKAMGWTPAQTIEAVATIAAGEVGRQKTGLPATTMQGLLAPQLSDITKKYGISETIAQDPQRLLMQLQQMQERMEQQAFTKMLTDIYGTTAATGVSKLLTTPRADIRKVLVQAATAEAAAAEQKEEQVSRKTEERLRAKAEATVTEEELDITTPEQYEEKVREIGESVLKRLGRREPEKQWIREFFVIGPEKEKEEAARRKWMEGLTSEEKFAIEEKYISYAMRYEQAWKRMTPQEKYEALTRKKPIVVEKIPARGSVVEGSAAAPEEVEALTPNVIEAMAAAPAAASVTVNNKYEIHYHNEHPTNYYPRQGSDGRGGRAEPKDLE